MEKFEHFWQNLFRKKDKSEKSESEGKKDEKETLGSKKSKYEDDKENVAIKVTVTQTDNKPLKSGIRKAYQTGSRLFY